MRILLASSEVAPFASSGDLGEMCGSLPRELALLGHSVAVIMPAYRQVRLCGQPVRSLDVWFDAPVGGKIMRGALLTSRLPGSDVPVFFVEQDYYFNRPELYRERGRDYIDNCERFVFFSRAVLEAIRLLPFETDVLHCNDWQTGLIPALLQVEYAHTAGYENIQSLFTIHDASRQGRFGRWEMLLTGLDWKYFNWKQMEFYGDLSLLKTGIVFADYLSTVSPRYAREIQTAEYGGGLEGALQQRRGELAGILSGVDDQAWNPAIDHALPARYSGADWPLGKARCKAELQRSLGLAQAPAQLLVGWLGPFDEEHGARLLSDVMHRWCGTQDVQWAAFGVGAREHEASLASLAKAWPAQAAVRFDTSERLARQLLGGCDLLVLPALRQPCGSRHFIALRYGAAPLVREVGGMADTIVDVTPANLAIGAANGFVFREFTSTALEDALHRAKNVYTHQHDMWSRMVTAGIHQDWSWAKAARQYDRLYEHVLASATPAAAGAEHSP